MQHVFGVLATEVAMPKAEALVLPRYEPFFNILGDVRALRRIPKWPQTAQSFFRQPACHYSVIRHSYQDLGHCTSRGPTTLARNL